MGESEILVSLPNIIALLGITIIPIGVAVAFFVKLQGQVSSLRADNARLNDDVREIRNNQTQFWAQQVNALSNQLGNTNTEKGSQ